MDWQEVKHTTLYEQLVDLARHVWSLSALVVYATVWERGPHRS